MPLPLLPPMPSPTTATLPPLLPPPLRCGHRHRHCCQHPHPRPHSFCHPIQTSIRTEPIDNAPAVTHSYCDTSTRTDWCDASVTNCQGACQGRWVQATAAHAKGSQLAAVSADPKAVLYDLAATASDSVQQLNTYPLGQLGTGTREWGPGMGDPVGERISAFAICRSTEAPDMATNCADSGDSAGYHQGRGPEGDQDVRGDEYHGSSHAGMQEWGLRRVRQD